MRRVSKKLTICVIIFFVIFGFFLNMQVQAATTSKNALNTAIDVVTGLADGIIGIMTWLYRLPVIAIVVAVLSIMSAIAGVFGYVTPDGSLDSNGGFFQTGFLGPDDIFFNKLLLTDANVFRIENGMPDAIVQIRQSIALWYYIMRVIAIVVLLGILIYIAIRMAISTVASEKASYKKMLVNWASSIGLVFLLHYVIVGISYINSTLIKILYNVYTSLNTANGSMDEAVGDLIIRSLDVSFIVGATSLVVVVLLIVQTFAFLVYYIKRMLTISFLIIISPLITITYSIDKLGDGKAQALNTWMKEYFFTVIIQPFHCIIYMVFVSMSISLLGNTGITSSMGGSLFGSGSDLIAALLSIFCIKFIWDAEKIFKNIFGIKVSETLGDAVMSAAIAGTMVSKGMNVASKAKTGAKTLKYSFKNGKMGEITSKVREGKLGQRLKIDSKSTEERKDRKFATKMGMNYDEMKHNHNTEGIRQIHEKRLEADKIRKENGLPNRIKNSKVIKGVKKFGESDFAQTYKRYIPTATGVAAAIIGGSAMYGSSAKTSLVEAGFAGYGSYKGMKSMADRLMYAKKENYTDNVEKSQATMAQIKGIENTGDKEDAARMHLDATRKEKQGELSNTEIGNKEKDARKKIRAMLTARDHMDKGDKNPEIDQIMSDIQNGIFLNNLDMDEIAKNYNLASTDSNKKAGDDLRDATGEFAEAKLYKQMAQDNQDLDDLMGQDGFYKIALQAWAGDAAYELAQNGNGSDTSTNTETTVEEQTETYTEEVNETHDMMNEVKNVTNEKKEERLDHIIEEQIKANEAMKNGELTPDKLKEEFDDAKSEIEALVRDVAKPVMIDPSGTKYYDEPKITNESNQIMQDVYKGVDKGKLDIAEIANKHGLKPEDLRTALESYLEKMLMRQMVDSNERMDEVGGEQDFYQSALASMIVNENMAAPTTGNEKEWNQRGSDVLKMMAEYAEEKRKGTPISPALDPAERAKKEKQDELLRQIEYLVKMMPKNNEQTQIKNAVKPVQIDKIEEINLSNGEKVDYSEIERMIKTEMIKAKTGGRQITTVEIFETIAKNHRLTGAVDLKPEEQIDLSAMTMQIQRELLQKRINTVLK